MELKPGGQYNQYGSPKQREEKFKKNNLKIYILTLNIIQGMQEQMIILKVNVEYVAMYKKETHKQGGLAEKGQRYNATIVMR